MILPLIINKTEAGGGGSGGGGAWGSITGILSNQTDLQAALDAIEAQITGNIDGGRADTVYGGVLTINGGGA